MIAEYAILPLGSASVHAQCPHVKSLLLYGPEGTGKSLLTQVWGATAGCHRGGGQGRRGAAYSTVPLAQSACP